MATRRQIEANQQNAISSTGPRTTAGRARSSKNALRHGLTAREVTVDEEEAERFAAFRDDMVEDLAPVGAFEEELVQRIVTCLWRLRRVLRVEAEVGVTLDFFASLSGSLSPNLVRYETAIDRMLQRARHDLERLQARRRGEPVAAPIAVEVTLAAGEQANAVPIVPRDAMHEPSSGDRSASEGLPLQTDGA